MSNPADHKIRPLLFFPIMAVLVVVVVVGVIRIVPGRSPSPDGATQAPPPPVAVVPPIKTTDERPRSSAPTLRTNTESDDSAAHGRGSVSSRDAADEEDAVVDNAVEQTGAAADEDAQGSTDPGAHGESAHPGDASAVAEGDETTEALCEVDGWRLGPVRIATSVFGFRTVGSSGRRYAVAAPRDQRYLWVTANFTRSGATAGSIAIVPHENVPSTLTLSGGGKSYLPIGFVRKDARPWMPWYTTAVSVESGSSAEATLAYLIPNVLSRAGAVLEGTSCGELDWPAARSLAVQGLVGYWEKSPELMSSLRYQDAIADSIASRDRVLLRFEPAGVDTIRATFPGRGIASTPLQRSPQAISGALSLQWGEQTSPAWVRMIENPRRVLLYVGDPSGPVFMFEPAK